LAWFLSLLGVSLALTFGSQAGVLVLPLELAPFLSLALKATLVAVTIWYGLRVGLRPVWAWVLGFSSIFSIMIWVSLVILLSRKPAFPLGWMDGRPFVGRDAATDDRISALVGWFMNKDPIARSLKNRSVTILFDAGYRPYPMAGVPQEPVVKDLPSWFVAQVVADVRSIRDSSREDFVRYLQSLDETAHKSLITVGEIAVEYGLEMENFVYEREIGKIPAGSVREIFKNNLLADCVTSARLRVLAWLYHAWFGDWYKPAIDRGT
jgi:hypothetical protein